jgi:hypothetical protein
MREASSPARISSGSHNDREVLLFQPLTKEEVHPLTVRFHRGNDAFFKVLSLLDPTSGHETTTSTPSIG